MARRTFTREFKLAAVRLVREGGISVARAARELDLHQNVLQRWLRELSREPLRAFPGKGRARRPQSIATEASRQERTGDHGSAHAADPGQPPDAPYPNP